MLKQVTVSFVKNQCAWGMAMVSTYSPLERYGISMLLR
jgi:hypothetical protein